MIAARRVHRLEALKAKLEADGARVVSVELDVTNEAACQAAVDRSVQELGGLDSWPGPD